MHVGYADVLQNDESSMHPTFKESNDTYTYILEIDDFGDVVGGEWIGDRLPCTSRFFMGCP